MMAISGGGLPAGGAISGAKNVTRPVSSSLMLKSVALGQKGESNMVLRRTCTALALAALVVFALTKASAEIVKPFLIALIALAHLEYSQIVAKRYPVLVWPGVLAGVIFMVSKFYFYDGAFQLLFFILAVLSLFHAPRGNIGARQTLLTFAVTALGFVYLPVMLSYLVQLATLPSPVGVELFWLLYVISIVKISDMGGFAFGLGSAKLFGGNHKMCPLISPNKSWEGMLGSIVGSCIVSFSLISITGFGIVKSLLFALTAAIAGTLGDLVESGIKRECGAKDSATFMPAGMGGFLDILDSLVFVPAIFYSLLK